MSAPYAPYDLDETPEQTRYAQPQYRKPWEQARVDMERCMLYETYKHPLPSGSKLLPVLTSKRERAPPINAIDNIADLMRSLTYGEMIELAGKLWAQKGDGEISPESLPAILHRWSKTRAR